MLHNRYSFKVVLADENLYFMRCKRFCCSSFFFNDNLSSFTSAFACMLKERYLI